MRDFECRDQLLEDVKNKGGKYSLEKVKNARRGYVVCIL